MEEVIIQHSLIKTNSHFERGTIILKGYDYRKNLSKQEKRGMIKIVDEKQHEIMLVITKKLQDIFTKYFNEEVKNGKRIYRKTKQIE